MRFTKSCVFLLLWVVAVAVADDDAAAPSPAADADGRAKLLVSKQIQNKYLVEGMDTVVKYSLYNIGDAAAVEIQLTESGFSTDDFDIAGGNLAVQLDRMAPKANNSFTVVVRPKKYGYFNFTSAEVRYRDNEDDTLGENRVVFSSDPGQGLIIALKDYERQFSAHMLDWLAFAVMTLPSLGIPFLLWHSSKAKYEALGKSKKD